MLSIGEFANLTGLSIKALRHYDEKGVLFPAEVDPISGYRRYSESQVRRGVIIRAMRDAGVPLPAVAAGLADGVAGNVLAEWRERVHAERAREDLAFENAALVLSSLSAGAEVRERICGAQPYVARLLTVPAEQDGAGDAEANEHLGLLFAALQADDLSPSGQFWTALREGREPGTAEVQCCWPTVRRLPSGWGDELTIIGELPRRRELVAIWSSQPGERLPETSIHPAAVALFDAIADRGIQLAAMGEVRQVVNGADDNDSYTVEIAVTIG